jgi:AraC-like DNA-binding protein
VARLAAELHVDKGRVRQAIAAAGLPAAISRRKYLQLYDPDWLHTELAASSITKLARRLGDSPRTVRDAARRADIPTRRPPAPGQLADHHWLTARRAQGWSVAHLAAELHTYTRLVRRAIAAAGLAPKLSRMHYPQLHDPDWVRTEIAASSVTDIARRLGASRRTVRDAAQRAGVEERRRAPPPPALADRAWLTRRLTGHASCSSLAIELGCSTDAVRRAVDDHGLSELVRQRRRYRQLYEPGWLDTQLQTRTRRDIAAEVGCSEPAVSAARGYLHDGTAAPNRLPTGA